MPSSAEVGSSPRGQLVAAWSISTVVIAGFFVTLRFITRGKILHVLGLEDWFIAAALLFSVGNTIGMTLQSEYALGQHGADVTLENLEKFLKAAFYTIICYNIGLTLTKVSILLLFLRIFSVTGVRTAAYVAMVVVVLYGIWLVFSTIFFCVPVQGFWDVTLTGAKCFPKEAKWFADAGLNIATDFAIFILPLPVLRALSLPRKQKIGLYIVFSVGFFICIVSIMRLWALYIGATSSDPTYDQVNVGIWSSIELNTAIVCACLTTIKPLIGKLFPRLLSSLRGGQSSYIKQSIRVDPHSNARFSLRAKPQPSMEEGNESERGIALTSRAEAADLESQQGSAISVKESEEISPVPRSHQR